MGFKFNPLTGQFDLDASGGTPAGSDTQVQFNDGGSFGADSNLIWKKTTDRLGVQKSAPLAAVHAAAVTGDTLDPPSDFSVSLVAEDVVDSPGSASATQVNGPDNPSSVSLSFTYIDQPIDGGSAAATQINLGAGGYTANGQTITYTVYAYRTVGGQRVRNPNGFQIVFTDTINDGSTTFDVNIAGWTTPNTYQDGYWVHVSNPSNMADPNSYKNVGNVTTWDDSATIYNDSYVDSEYQSTGASWSPAVAQYKTVSGTDYRSLYIDDPQTDGNVSGAYMILNLSWGSIANDGFIYKSAQTLYQDAGTSTSFNDYGQPSGSDISAFSTICFPYMDVALPGSTGTSASFNYTPGAFVADGSGWTAEVWEYQTALDDTKYYVSSPDTYSLGTDAGDYSYFKIDGSCTPGPGNGRVVIVRKNGTSVASVNLSGGTSSFSVNGDESVISTSLAISGYSGLTWNWRAYGKITSPSTKYSPTYKAYSNTDNNPSSGFIWAHSLSSFGNATDIKLIEWLPRPTPGYFYEGVTSTSVNQIYSVLGNDTVTPNNIGYQSNGTVLTRTYVARAFGTVNTLGIYSQSVTDSTTDPNDGNYYVVNITHSAVSGASNYKISRVVNGGPAEWRLDTDLDFNDDTTLTWENSNSTVTPTQAPGSAIIAERSTTLTTEPGALKIRNSSSGTLLGFIDYDYWTGAAWSEMGKIGINTNGLMWIRTFNAGLWIGSLSSSPHTIFGGDTTNKTIFNNNASSDYRVLLLAGSTGTLMSAECNTNTVAFGQVASSWAGGDPTCAVFIRPKDGTDFGLVLSSHSSGSASSLLMTLRDDAAATNAGFTNDGRLFVADPSNQSPGSGHFAVGAGSSTRTQILLRNTGTLPTSPIAGGIEYSAGAFYGTNSTPARRRFVQDLTSSTSTYFWRSDANGYPTADTALLVNSGTTVDANLSITAKQGLSIDASKNLTMGSGSNIVLNTSTGTKIGTSTSQKLGFFNATAVVQPSGVTPVAAGTTLGLWASPSAIAVTEGGTGTGTAFTAGSVVFAGTSGVYSQDNANLFWDNTNDRLGIGTAAPSHQFHMLKSDGTNPVVLMVQNTVGNSTGKVELMLGTRNTVGDRDVGSKIQAIRTDTGSAGTTDLAVFTSTGTTMTERLRLLGSGNFGVGTSSPGSKLDVSGSFQCDSITNDTGLASGTYTPTLTNVANLDSSSAAECQYLRVGNTVTVSGKVTIDPTLAATSTQLGISLPVASNIGAVEDCAGVAFASGIAGQGAAIIGDATNDRAQMQFISADVTSQAMYFTFSYQVI